MRLKKKSFLVWCSESPGGKTYVRRNLFQRLFYGMFAQLGEKEYSYQELKRKYKYQENFEEPVNLTSNKKAQEQYRKYKICYENLDNL